jgi:hypothetical protein
VQRHSRQSRLADVGPQGQARIARALVVVPGQGLAAEIAARYLAGAGVAAVYVRDEPTAAAARAADPGVRVEVDPKLATTAPEETEVLAVLTEPSACAIASGALLALRVLRRALATEPS